MLLFRCQKKHPFFSCSHHKPVTLEKPALCSWGNNYCQNILHVNETWSSSSSFIFHCKLSPFTILLQFSHLAVYGICNSAYCNMQIVYSILVSDTLKLNQMEEKKKKESVIKVPLWPQAVDKLWSVVVKQQLFRFKTKL